MYTFVHVVVRRHDKNKCLLIIFSFFALLKFRSNDSGTSKRKLDHKNVCAFLYIFIRRNRVVDKIIKYKSAIKCRKLYLPLIGRISTVEINLIPS